MAATPRLLHRTKKVIKLFPLPLAFALGHPHPDVVVWLRVPSQVIVFHWYPKLEVNILKRAIPFTAHLSQLNKACSRETPHRLPRGLVRPVVIHARHSYQGSRTSKSCSTLPPWEAISPVCLPPIHSSSRLLVWTRTRLWTGKPRYRPPHAFK